MPKGFYRCSRCGIRHVQEVGLCRRCSRETGQFVVFAQEQARQRRLAEAKAALLRPEPILVEPRSIRIGRLEYDIVWDGSIRPVLESSK
jgi:predicted ATP-dependent serine protease